MREGGINMGLGKRFEPKACTVYCQNGEYLIKTPNGEMIPCLHWIRVSDNWPDGIATLILKMQCNIASNNEHFDLPVKLYNENDVQEMNRIIRGRYDALNEKFTLHKEVENIQITLLRQELSYIKSKWWHKLFKSL